MAVFNEFNLKPTNLLTLFSISLILALGRYAMATPRRRHRPNIELRIIV